MLAAASVSEASVASGVLAFFLPVSLSFPGNFFLYRVCLADFSVVIHYDYAGALLMWW